MEFCSELSTARFLISRHLWVLLSNILNLAFSKKTIFDHNLAPNRYPQIPLDSLLIWPPFVIWSVRDTRRTLCRGTFEWSAVTATGWSQQPASMGNVRRCCFPGSGSGSRAPYERGKRAYNNRCDSPGAHPPEASFGGAKKKGTRRCRDSTCLLPPWRLSLSLSASAYWYRWNSLRGVSQNVETVSPILEILFPIVKTLSADVEKLSPIGEILSLIWEMLSLQVWETPRLEFHLVYLA